MFLTLWTARRYPSVTPAGFLGGHAPLSVASGMSLVMSRVWFDEQSNWPGNVVAVRSAGCRVVVSCRELDAGKTIGIECTSGGLD